MRRRITKRMRKVFGGVGHAAGVEAEQRVLDLLLARKLPSWVTGTPRAGNPDEDRAKKWDVVVPTDVGDIGIQVKRSFHRAVLERRHLPEDIAVVGAGEGRHVSDLWADIMRELHRARQERHAMLAADTWPDEPFTEDEAAVVRERLDDETVEL